MTQVIDLKNLNLSGKSNWWNETGAYMQGFRFDYFSHGTNGSYVDVDSIVFLGDNQDAVDYYIWERDAVRNVNGVYAGEEMMTLFGEGRSAHNITPTYDSVNNTVVLESTDNCTRHTTIGTDEQIKCDMHLSENGIYDPFIYYTLPAPIKKGKDNYMVVTYWTPNDVDNEIYFENDEDTETYGDYVPGTGIEFAMFFGAETDKNFYPFEEKVKKKDFCYSEIVSLDSIYSKSSNNTEIASIRFDSFQSRFYVQKGSKLCIDSVLFTDTAEKAEAIRNQQLLKRSGYYGYGLNFCENTTDTSVGLRPAHAPDMVTDVQRIDTTDGTNVQLSTENKGPNQRFKIEKIDITDASLAANGSELDPNYMDLGKEFTAYISWSNSEGITRYLGKDTASSNVASYIPNPNSDLQKWKFVRRDDNGSYEIYNCSDENSYALDVSAYSVDAGSNVQTSTPHHGLNQQWFLYDYGDEAVTGMPETVTAYSADTSCSFDISTEPVRNGYIFGGWSETPNGTPIQGDTYTVTGEEMKIVNKTLYAVWYDENDYSCLNLEVSPLNDGVSYIPTTDIYNVTLEILNPDDLAVISTHELSFQRGTLSEKVIVSKNIKYRITQSTVENPSGTYANYYTVSTVEGSCSYDTPYIVNDIVTESKTVTITDYLYCDSAINVCFNFYNRKVEKGQLHDIDSTPTQFTKSINAISILSNADAESLDSAVEIAAAEFKPDNIMETYTFFPSQAKAIEGMQKFKNYHTSANYTSEEVQFHTDCHGNPQTSGEKWVTYYDAQNNEITPEQLAADKVKYNDITNITVWYYNSPKKYTVTVYGCIDGTSTNTTSISGANGQMLIANSSNQSITGFYNTRMGNESVDGSFNASSPYLAEYGMTVSYLGETPTTAKQVGDNSFLYWSSDPLGKNVLTTDIRYEYRITKNLSLYAVYGDKEIFKEKKGVTTIANGVDTYYDANGVSRTRVNTVINPYNCDLYDTKISDVGIFYIKNGGQLTDGVEYETLKENLLTALNGGLANKQTGSCTVAGYEVMKYQLLRYNATFGVPAEGQARLTSKNRLQFVGNFSTEKLVNGDFSNMASVTVMKRDGVWYVSDNYIVYKNGIAYENGTPLDSKITTFSFVEIGNSNTVIKCGDANLDDNIDINDATLIQKHNAHTERISENGLKAADVDKDGSVNVKDATAIQKYLAGIETGYEIGKILV